jgi:hypothetical protein
MRGFCCIRFRVLQCHWSHFLPTYAPTDHTLTGYWFGRLTGFGVYTGKGGTGRDVPKLWRNLGATSQFQPTLGWHTESYILRTHIGRHGELLPGFLCISVCACVCTHTHTDAYRRGLCVLWMGGGVFTTEARIRVSRRNAIRSWR